ncbi:MAG: hypothetical protein FJ143_08270 [Deltaproteobacteria bacterium]|nr:hypothetical protein [Deltaproteobacteria bacterium]MBM4297720.1 hypothetical protein [Deltaproteobacteria bacterium]
MTSIKGVVLAIALLLLVSANGQTGEPAPWYKWKSRVNNQIVCSQTAPGDNWERESGPYTDSHCDTLVNK